MGSLNLVNENRRQEDDFFQMTQKAKDCDPLHASLTHPQKVVASRVKRPEEQQTRTPHHPHITKREHRERNLSCLRLTRNYPDCSYLTDSRLVDKTITV